MNRAERRRAAHRPDIKAIASVVQALTECPDCNSDTRLKPDESGIYHLTVAHDRTCPLYNRKATQR